LSVVIFTYTIVLIMVCVTAAILSLADFFVSRKQAVLAAWASSSSTSSTS